MIQEAVRCLEMVEVVTEWMEGALDGGALERGLNEIIQRHEILRTNFVASDGNPGQTIAGHRTLKLPVAVLKSVSPL